MTPSRSFYDPELTPEARMDRMRKEMFFLRRTIIDLVPEEFRKVIDPPYDLSQKDSFQWTLRTAQRVIELTAPDAHGNAACPLCGDVPRYTGVGYSYPAGLKRHLLGTHQSQLCPVMYAADGLRRVHHREAYPGDYGPYGCD